MKRSRLTKRPSLTHPFHSFVIEHNSFVMRQQKKGLDDDDGMADEDNEFFVSQSLSDSGGKDTSEEQAHLVEKGTGGSQL